MPQKSSLVTHSLAFLCFTRYLYFISGARNINSGQQTPQRHHEKSWSSSEVVGETIKGLVHGNWLERLYTTTHRCRCPMS